MPLDAQQSRVVQRRASTKPSDHLLHRMKPGLSGNVGSRMDLNCVAPYYEDRVLVKRIPPPPASSTLALPDSDRDKVGNQTGVVVAVGKGNRLKNGERIPLEVKLGDRVKYKRVPPQEFEQDGDVYTFLYEEQHIDCILEP